LWITEFKVSADLLWSEISKQHVHQLFFVLVYEILALASYGLWQLSTKAIQLLPDFFLHIDQINS
jgi:hypothetical protein